MNTDKPTTWGTTATLTSDGSRAVGAMTVLGVVIVLALALLSEDTSLTAYAEVVGTIVAAGLVALGGVRAAGAYGHSSQYRGIGSPTASSRPKPPGAIPADRDLPAQIGPAAEGAP